MKKKNGPKFYEDIDALNWVIKNEDKS